MNTFQQYLDEIGEIGYVEQVLPGVVLVAGLPGPEPKRWSCLNQESWGKF